MKQEIKPYEGKKDIIKKDDLKKQLHKDTNSSVLEKSIAYSELSWHNTYPTNTSVMTTRLNLLCA